VAVIGAFGVLATACSDTSSTDDDTTRDSAGDVVEGGDVGVFALQEGDCLDASVFLEDASGEEDTEVEQFAALPCEESHTGEVILLDAQFFGDLTEYPASDALYEASTAPCIEALDEYTGTSYASSPFDFAPLIPSEESWDVMEDRGLVCIGVTLNDAQDGFVETTTSMRAAD
jgi:hypothetical protein